MKKRILFWSFLWPILGFAQNMVVQTPELTEVFQSLSSPVNSVKFSPDGTQILIGSSHSSALLFNLENGKSISLKGHQSRINDLAFSPNGKYILTASNDETARLWNTQGKQIKEFKMQESVYSVAFSPNWITDSLLLIGTWRTSSLWNSQGKLIKTLEEGNRIIQRVNFAQKEVFFTAGKEVFPSLGRMNRALERQSRNTLLALSPDGKNLLSGAEEVVASWNIEKWPIAVSNLWDTPELTNPSSKVLLRNINGKVQSIIETDNSPIYSLCYTPDGKGFLIGTDTEIIQYDLTGAKIRTYKGHHKPIVSIAFSPDNLHFITGSSDYSTKLWSLEQAEALATIVYLNTNDWVVLTPNGLFDGTPNALNSLYYDYAYQGESIKIKLDQLKMRYYEPGLLSTLLGFSGLPLRQVAEIRAIELNPKITAQYNLYTIDISLRRRNGGVGKVSLFINGREMEENVRPVGLDSFTLDFSPYRSFLDTRDGAKNKISLYAYNEAGWLKSQAVVFDENLPSGYSSGPPDEFQPKMFVLSIGTSDYQGDKLDLQFADQDARSIALALKSAGSRLFDKARGTEVVCLTTTIGDSLQMAKSSIHWEFSNKENIEKRFVELAEQVKIQDIIVLYFSGHGLTKNIEEESQFYYLSQGVTSEEMLKDAQLRKQHTISTNELTQWLAKIKALKKILIVDACSSGKIVEDLVAAKARSINPAQVRAFDRMQDRTGMFVLSGSADNKASYEATEYGQGLLTYSLLNGMRGSAIRKTSRGNYIDVMQLFQFAADEVPQLASRIKGIQVPVLGVPAGAASFDIGIVDEFVDIPMATNKPVIKRSSFLDKNTFSDPLNLVEKVEFSLLKENNRGLDADFVFVDISNYPNAYSLGGLYEVIDGQIHLQIKLSKGKQIIQEFIIPPTDRVEVLVKSINRAFSRYIMSLKD